MHELDSTADLVSVAATCSNETTDGIDVDTLEAVRIALPPRVHSSQVEDILWLSRPQRCVDILRPLDVSLDEVRTKRNGRHAAASASENVHLVLTTLQKVLHDMGADKARAARAKDGGHRSQTSR